MLTKIDLAQRGFNANAVGQLVLAAVAAAGHLAIAANLVCARPRAWGARAWGARAWGGAVSISWEDARDESV